MTDVPTIAAIQEAVASAFGTTRAEILGPSRKKPLSHVRAIAVQTARELTGASFPLLARAFNRSDHSTMHHADRHAAVLLNLYPEYRDLKAAAIRSLTPQP